MITIEPPEVAGGLKKAELSRFVTRARKAAGLRGEVHVLLTDDAAVRRLNKCFRGKDKATDVLSFPAAEFVDEVAGDLAISVETAARQGAAYGHGVQDEVKVLLLHGVLHLAGMDHEVDEGEMAGREAELRAELGLSTGLIARAGAKAAKKKSVVGVRASAKKKVAR